MYSLLEISCAEHKVDQHDLFSAKPTSDWLRLSQEVQDKLGNLSFSFSLNNKLFLLPEPGSETSPFLFVASGAVNRHFGGKALIRNFKFDKVIDCIEMLLLESKLGYNIFSQLSTQYEVDKHQINSFTGASISFTGKKANSYWNVDGYTTAVSPIAKYLLKELELGEEEKAGFPELSLLL